MPTMAIEQSNEDETGHAINEEANKNLSSPSDGTNFKDAKPTTATTAPVANVTNNIMKMTAADENSHDSIGSVDSTTPVAFQGGGEGEGENMYGDENSCDNHNHHRDHEHEPLIDSTVDSPPPPIQTIETNGMDSNRTLLDVMSPLDLARSSSTDNRNSKTNIAAHADANNITIQQNNTLNTFTLMSHSVVEKNNEFGDESLNTAFIFLQPIINNNDDDACTRKKMIRFIRSTLLDQINPFDEEDGRIVSDYDIDAETISKEGLVDNHYRDIATYAKGIKGCISSKQIIPEESFEKIFGEKLGKVIGEKRIYNAIEALSSCACTPKMLYNLWKEAERFETKSMKKVAKFGNGYYCANLLIHGKNVYVINGFYMAMRETYVSKGSSIHAFVIQWNASSLKWRDFTEKVIGCEDPIIAEKGSIRQLIYEKYQELGLSTQPDLLHNVIHASSSPLSALAEQCNWLQCDIKSVEFGRLLLSKGIPEATISDWCHNFDVKIPGKPSSYSSRKDGSHNETVKLICPFDMVKDLDTKDCLQKLIGLYDYELFSSTEQQAQCCKCII